MGRARNTSMEGPVTGVVVEVPAVDFTGKFGDAPEHVPARSDRGFDLQKDALTVCFFLGRPWRKGSGGDVKDVFCASWIWEGRLYHLDWGGLERRKFRGFLDWLVLSACDC